MYPPILSRVEELGFKVFSSGDYDLNIIGIRSKTCIPNKFDDILLCIYKEGGMWMQQWWPITTDPGKYWLENPLNKAGCAAVVADQQYRGVWKIGKHRNVYTALVQTGGKIKVHRDDNEDSIVDYRQDNIQEGYFGINCHRSTTRAGGAYSVDKYSAGCQVFQDPKHFEEFMELCKLQLKEHPTWTKFSYTLLNQWW